MVRKAFLSGIGLLSIILSGYSQRPDLRFFDPLRAFDLPDENITAINQDTAGFIWIGTHMGLARYDGYELKIHKHTVGDSASLINNEVTGIFRASSGDLWIGTRRGLCRYMPEYETFKWIVSESTPGFESIEITDMGEDRYGVFHVSTATGVFRFDESDSTFSMAYNNGTGDISAFLFDRHNNLWIAEIKEGGLIRVDSGTGKKTIFKNNPEDSNSISSNSVADLAIAGDTLWIATYFSGVNMLDIGSNNFRRYSFTNPYERECRSVYIDEEGIVWVTDIYSLKVYDAENDAFSVFYHYSDDPFSIKSYCNGIFLDNQGNYWTTHSGTGVGMSIGRKGFITFDNNPGSFWHVSADDISAITEDENGNLWMANPFNGIDVFNWSTASTHTFHHNPSDAYSLGEGAVFSLFRDSRNTIWVGTYSGGLQYFDPGANRFISYRHKPGDEKSIACNDVRSIAEDRSGDLWIAVHGKGIDRFDRETGRFIHFNSSNSNLSNDFTFQVVADSRGDIWVATIWGLNVMRKGEDHFRQYLQTEGDTASLTDNEILSLHEDGSGNIWAGTANGLNRYNRETDSFTRFTRGLNSTTINVVLSDTDGLIWLGTSRGISRLDPSTGECKNFTRRDGLVSSEIYPRSGYINPSHDMVFGGDRGVNIVSPDKLKFNMMPPRVYISGLSIFNKEVTDYSEKGILKKSILLTESIRLDHRQNVITFRFVALDFLSPSRNSYQYMLEGFDKEWISAGNRREVTYTNLDPRHYVFRVRASNNDGYWNMQGDALEVIVTPPWYRTLLFRIVLFLLILTLIFGLVAMRTYSLQHQKQHLEEQVKERTLELRQKNDLLLKQAGDLSRTNTELQQANSSKDKLFSIIAHDIMNPFNTLLGFADVLREDFHKIDDNEKMEIITMIGTSSDRIHELLENLLKWSKAQTGKINVNRRMFRLAPVVESAVTIFGPTASRKRITLTTMVPGDTEVFADEDMTATIIRNLLNNAIKFTHEGGSVTVTAVEEDDMVALMVTDTGTGIPGAMVSTLFTAVSKEVKVGTDGERGSGLGLLICREFADINGGSMSVASEPGKGSTFTLRLPAYNT